MIQRPPALVALTLLVAVLVALAVALLAAWSGRVEVAADAGHSGPVEWWLETTRKNAVERRAAGISPPPAGEWLTAEARRRGGELYRRHCAACHGAPGPDAGSLAPEPFAEGLNPAPPDLTTGIRRRQAAEAFWVTAHGIRMTAMPAFGDTLTEGETWDVLAWLVAVREGDGVAERPGSSLLP